MDTLIVGDLHGKIDIARELLSDTAQDIVFVGDYLDSFEGNVIDQIDLLDMILDAVQTRANVIALFGNHELSYMHGKWRCSGWNEATQAHIIARAFDMWANLEMYAIIDGFLITHAGVSSSWLPEDVDHTLSAIDEFLTEQTLDELSVVGWSRGGYAECGGPFWCDWWGEFQPIPDVNQIVGHTRQRRRGEHGILKLLNSQNYNIDCLDTRRELIRIKDSAAIVEKF